MALDHVPRNGQFEPDAAADFDQGLELRWRQPPHLCQPIGAADGHPDRPLIAACNAIDRDAQFVGRQELAPLGEHDRVERLAEQRRIAVDCGRRGVVDHTVYQYSRRGPRERRDLRLDERRKVDARPEEGRPPASSWRAATSRPPGS